MASQELRKPLSWRSAAACLFAVLLGVTDSEALSRREQGQSQQHVPRVVYQASSCRDVLETDGSALPYQTPVPCRKDFLAADGRRGAPLCLCLMSC